MEKLQDAVKLSREQSEAFQELHESMENDSKALVAQWSTLSTEPELVNGKWTSVFMMKEAPGTKQLLRVTAH